MLGRMVEPSDGLSILLADEDKLDVEAGLLVAS